jgi:hypothetical protein
VENQGSFNIKFDLMKVTPNQAARTFCLDKQIQFNVLDENLESHCIRGVDEFIVRDLQRQEILKRDDVVEPAVEETQQQTEQTTPEPVVEQEQQVETPSEQTQTEVPQTEQTQVTTEPSQVEPQREIANRAPPAVPRDTSELPIPPHEEHPQEVRAEAAVEESATEL